MKQQNSQTQAQIKRLIAEAQDHWKPLREHPVQLGLAHDDVRFKVVPAGRRSGKTIRAKRKLAKTAMVNPRELLFAAAPTREQAKRIWWEDLKKLCFCGLLGEESHREGELIIMLPNGSQIHVIGLDRPERMEGIPWTGGVIDEIGNVDADAWPENIRPALSTKDLHRPDYKAWCWLIGVPEGLNHYFDLAEYARTSDDPEWRLYHWKSAEILDPEEIEAAKRSLSLKQFRQEYEATFEGAAGKIYDDYGDANVTREEIARHEQIHWMHDFNYSPLSSAIGVRRENRMLLLDEIVLESAVARQTAVEFCDRYADHENKHVLLYGDPAGQAGEKHGQVSNYTAIQQYLREHGWKVDRKVKAAAPAIRDRQNAVRAMICNANGDRRLFVNASRAKTCHKGLATVQVKPGSSFQEVDGHFQHITTAIGYCIDYEWPVLIDPGVQKKVVVPVPNVNHYSKGMRR